LPDGVVFAREMRKEARLQFGAAIFGERHRGAKRDGVGAADAGIVEGNGVYEEIGGGRDFSSRARHTTPER